MANYSGGDVLLQVIVIVKVDTDPDLIISEPSLVLFVWVPQDKIAKEFRTRSGVNSFQYHSAASLLWPSRALSLLISSSAASEITVPGGKIASAPAL